ncbi:unnamed protein product [Orchesella dallaii]
MLRSPAPPIINGGGPFPFSMCLTCPPYPHQHFEHFDHYQIHQNAHNHHLSQGSLHQQQHHLTAPSGSSGHQGGGNSSGPPSVESGGTASTGSTGGGGVTAITLGRNVSKHHQHSHHHHHHHHHGNHHTKSHRSSSTGSSGSRHLQENLGILIEPVVTNSKSNTTGRARRSIQPPGSLQMPKHSHNPISKKDSVNVMAALLPGMSFTLPAQSSLQKQQHHQHHHHHHHHPHLHQFLLQQQQQALASLSNSTSAALSLPSAPVVSNNATSTASSLATATTANGLRSSGATAGASTCLDKHPSLVSANNGSLVPVIASTANTSSSQQISAGQHLSSANNVKLSNHGTGHHRERNVEDDSPPPLPPKSPRITSKPTRPHDFPQQLQLQVVDSSVETAGGGNSSTMVPPPPPRRHSHSQVDHQAKYVRLLQDQSSNKLPHSIIDPSQSMTLPSPILPPTPPPDVVMESPMSDSGPIISPPPAFSTPVTPMIDRQNSTTSDKSGAGAGNAVVASTNTTGGNNTGRLRSLSQSTSHYNNVSGFSVASNITNSGGVVSKSHGQPPQQQQQQQQQQQHHYHTPLSGTVSMSAISSVSGRSNAARNNKSIPDLSSDVSMRYSPMSRSRSNSSPMSPDESMPATSPDGDEDDDDDDADEDPTSSSVADNGHDGDDDCSEKVQYSSISPKLLAAGMARRNSAKHLSHHHHHTQPHNNKITLIPKSVTENFLYKVGTNGANIGTGENEVVKTSNTGAQTETNQQSRIRGTVEGPSPARRPILRSKSDLSHRYAKAEKSATLTPGFTLVHVDLGLPPPLPMHNSISTNDFSKNPTTTGVSGSNGNHHKSHHHIYQTPNSAVNTGTAPISHYHEPHNSHSAHDKRTTKSASDLEKFFDMLGLENTPTPAPIPLSEIKDKSAKAGSESPVFFSSISSVDSAPRRSGSADSEDSPLDDKLGSRTVGGYGKFGPAGGPSILVQHGEPSIVERNARVIKWLFNCRKAMDRR